jgi:hypothetical protein
MIEDKAGVRCAGHSDGDIQESLPPPVSLLHTVAKQSGAAVLRGGA